MKDKVVVNSEYVELRDKKGGHIIVGELERVRQGGIIMKSNFTETRIFKNLAEVRKWARQHPWED